MEMYSYLRTDEYTYFTIGDKTELNQVSEGSYILIEISSTLQYRNRRQTYFAKLVKSTTHFFEVIRYCSPGFHSNVESMLTSSIEKSNQHTQRISKARLLNIYNVTSHSKVETRKFSTNSKEYAEGYQQKGSSGS